MLRGEVTAVEVHPGRARGSSREETPGRTSASSTPTCASSTSAASTARSSTRRAPGSACSPAAPTCAGARSRCRSSSSSCSRAAAERTRPGGTIVYSVCTLNADENEAVVDASGLERRAARRGVAAVRAPEAAGVPAHAAAPRRHVGLLHRPPAQAVGSRAMPWRDWIRTVEVEPSLYGADFAQPRRPDRGAAARRMPRVPLRRRRRALRRADHDGADRAAVDRADRPPLRRRDRRAPDGREPGEVLRGRRGRGRRQRHVPLRGGRRRRRRRSARRASTGCRSASRSTPRRSPETVAAVAGDADIVLCMAIHPGYSGQPFLRGDVRPRRAAARRAAGGDADPGRRRRRATTTSSSCATRARRCSSRRRRSSRARTCRAAYRRLVQALA